MVSRDRSISQRLAQRMDSCLPKLFYANAHSGNMRDGRTVAGVSGRTDCVCLKEQQTGAGVFTKNLHRAPRLWGGYTCHAKVPARSGAQYGSGGTNQLERKTVPGSADQSTGIRKDEKDKDFDTWNTIYKYWKWNKIASRRAAAS